MIPGTLARRVCGKPGCGRLRWRPYSWKYCPVHFVENGEAKGILAWVRDRFHGVVNGSTATMGDVDWGPGDYSRDDIVELYTELPYSQIDSVKEAQWRNETARDAARSSPAGRRRVPATTIQREVQRINEGAY